MNIKHDLDKLEKALYLHEKRLMKVAVPQAINRTLVTVRSEAAKEISATTGITQADIKKGIKHWKAGRKKHEGSLNAKSATAKNLIKYVRAAVANHTHFRSRTRKGKFKHPGVKAKTWGKSQYYRGTFIGRSRKGQLKVYKRGKSGEAESVYGPSVRDEFIKEPLQAKLKRTARLRFRIELTAAINNQIARQKI